MIDEFPAATPNHAVLGSENGFAVFGFDGERSADTIRHFNQFQQVGIAQMRFRKPRNIGYPDAGFVECIELGADTVRPHATDKRHPVHIAGCGMTA